MFQNNALFDSLTAFENVALPLREASKLNKAEIQERVDEMLVHLELSDSADRYPGNFRRYEARALGVCADHEAASCLFDEPTTGLDPERKFSVFEMIADYRERFGFTAYS